LFTKNLRVLRQILHPQWLARTLMMGRTQHFRPLGINVDVL
jgi:hypothetical protein